MNVLAVQTQANKAWHLHQIKSSTSKTCSNYLECGFKAKWAHQQSLIRMKKVNFDWLRHIDRIHVYLPCALGILLLESLPKLNV